MAGEIEVIAKFKRKDQQTGGPVLPVVTAAQVEGLSDLLMPTLPFVGTPQVPQVVQANIVYYFRGNTYKWRGQPGRSLSELDPNSNDWQYVAGAKDKLPVFVDLEEWGVVADAYINVNPDFEFGTDNGPALMAMRERLLTQYPNFALQPHFKFIGPRGGGSVAYSNNRWLEGFRSFELDMQGRGYYPIYRDEYSLPLDRRDNMFQRTFYNGELLQTNTLTYKGTKEYMNCPKIATAQPGDTYIIVLNPSEIADKLTYRRGARFTVASKETVFRGYPWGVRHFEQVLTIVGIDYQSGYIEFDRPLQYEHRDDWPDCTGSSGGGSGAGRIIPLDHSLRHYCQYAKFTDGVCYSSSPEAKESFAFVANEVVLERVKCYKSTTPTECLKSWIAYNCTFGIRGGDFEGDKLVGDVEHHNCTNLAYMSNFGGCRSLKVVGGTIHQSIQACAPYVHLSGVTIIASEYYAGTQQKLSDPAIFGYAGRQPIYQYVVENLRFAGTNLSTSFIEATGGYIDYYIGEGGVTADGKIKAFWDGSDNQEQGLKFWKCADIGTALFTKDGAKGGRITSIEPVARGDGSYDVLVGVSGPKPAVGETWTFTNLLKWTDRGGHKVIDGSVVSRQRRLYAKEMQQWAGYQGNENRPSQLVFTADDLRPNAQLQVQVDGIFDGFELICTSVAQGSLSITLNPERPAFTKFFTKLRLNTLAARKLDAYGILYGGLQDWSPTPGQPEPDLDQVNRAAVGQYADLISIYCGNWPAIERGDFKLIIHIRKV